MSGSRKTACDNHSKAYVKNGFHLIEILIVFSLLAILCSFALPLYTDYVRDTKRTDAKIMLLRYAAALERYYFLHHSYKGATAERLHLPEVIADNQYHIQLTHLSETGYVVSAIPQGVQALRDKNCATLSLNQADERTVTGHHEAAACWR